MGRIQYVCENITFPQLLLQTVTKYRYLKTMYSYLWIFEDNVLMTLDMDEYWNETENNKLTMCMVQKRLSHTPRLGGHWRVGIQAVGYAFKISRVLISLHIRSMCDAKAS